MTVKTVKLWTGRKITPEAIPLLDIATHVVVHRAQKGHYQFLLGADIVEHKGTLFCGWGNSKKNENDSGSIMACRRSVDGGLTWKDFEVIAPGSKGKGAHSHGAFCVQGDSLYALAPFAEYKLFGDSYPNLSTELFKLDNKTDKWDSMGIVISGEQFWKTAPPRSLDNGNLIMPGIICKKQKAEPAVAISDGGRLDKWRIIQIATPKRNKNWSEGGLLIDGNKISLIYRNSWNNLPKGQIALSDDYGESWTRGANTNIPMTPSKPCCGTLSTGQRYIIFNPVGNYRDSLAIAVSQQGEQTFSKIWRIQHGASPLPRTKGAGKKPQWAYPSAYEFDNKLYIVYAVGKEDCMLTIIPLSTLK